VSLHASEVPPTEGVAVEGARIKGAATEASETLSDAERADLLVLIADHFGVLASSLASVESLTADLGADDIDRRELLITIEELLGIRFPPGEMARLDTIRGIQAAVMVAKKIPDRTQSEESR
jgi:acyl carrier protein